jgi:hypothetical protein
MLGMARNENFNGDSVRGLLRRRPDLDIVRVQDIGLRRTPDPDILVWAASQRRALLSHDVSTVPPAAYERIANGLGMPGVFIVPDRMPIGQAIEEILFLSLNVETDEWKDQVLFLPL